MQKFSTDPSLVKRQVVRGVIGFSFQLAIIQHQLNKTSHVWILPPARGWKNNIINDKTICVCVINLLTNRATINQQTSNYIHNALVWINTSKLYTYIHCIYIDTFINYRKYFVGIYIYKYIYKHCHCISNFQCQLINRHQNEINKRSESGENERLLFHKVILNFLYILSVVQSTTFNQLSIINLICLIMSFVCVQRISVW